MSYELFFTQREQVEHPDYTEFVAYFQDRKNYLLEDNHAHYQNVDSGIYFYFEFDEGLPERDKDEPLEEAGYILIPIVFSIHLFRPHVFALEAADELQAFIDHFELHVVDPQSDGMGEGLFTREGFLQSWSHSNAFAVEAICQQHPEHPFPCTAAATIKKWWRWNVDRERYEHSLEGEAYVPKFNFIWFEEQVCSAVIWGDAGPVALPEVDYVIIVKHEIRDDFREGDEPEVVLLPWQAITPWCARYGHKVYGETDHWLIEYPTIPDDLKQWWLAITGPHDFKIMTLDQVLDAEIVAMYLETTAD